MISAKNNSEESNKIIGYILSRDRSPKFYKNYPRLFCNYFNCKNVSHLSKAGYFLYLSIILSDMLIDNGRYDLLKKIMVLQEKALIIFTSIFKENSLFWKSLNTRRNEFFEAVDIEKSLVKKEKINFMIYKELADKKSAFGKLAIDSLFILNDRLSGETYKKLILSHKYFSIGFQLYDDVVDFKEDFEKGQFNFAIYKLTRIIDFKKHNHDVDILNKLLFIKGIGQEILIISVEQFEKAISILDTMKIKSKWLKTVIEMKNTVESYLDVTYEYLNTIKAKL
jgi:hypothetical protein